MIEVTEYLEKVKALSWLLPSDSVPIGEGYGRVLAQAVTAELPVPPFTNSAMDGYAVRGEDLRDTSARFAVVGDVPAGTVQLPTVGPQQAARIMTGSPLPPGADTVVPVELSDQEPGPVPLPNHVELQYLPTGKNVRHKGEDVQVGETVLPAGLTWSPRAGAAAASLGHKVVELRRKPKVAIISTGSELVPPGESLQHGQIPDSNSILLAGLVEQMGGEPVLVTSVPDDTEQFLAALEAGKEADILVTSGAVSEGAFEVVRETLEGQADFVRVAMQPGKPQACGTLNVNGSKLAFLGVPGNPVSVFVSAHVYLRPLLDGFQGKESSQLTVSAPALTGWKTPDGRAQYVPTILTEEGVRPSHRLGSGSHLVASLPLANAIAIVPAQVHQVHPGDVLQVLPLQ